MPRKKKIKPITFRLYPEGSFLYCEVNVWPTQKAMYANNPLNRNYEAACGGREEYIVPAKRRGKKQRVRKTGLFAEANFNKRQLGIGVVSHEMTHAAFCFAERRGMRLEEAKEHRNETGWKRGSNAAILDQDGVEERFCYALGEMCKQFTQKCYDLGLYQDCVASKT